jgi:5-methyltetrahydropteroyltriglutamate--homocysteine methyltransferase
MSVAKPPYRADHVGSLLRPEPVKEARKKFYEDKSISADELKSVEDTAIVDLIKMQEEVGLPVVTDGELRRAYWHYDFMGMLTGLDMETRHRRRSVRGRQAAPVFPTINGQARLPRRSPDARPFPVRGGIPT